MKKNRIRIHFIRNNILINSKKINSRLIIQNKKIKKKGISLSKNKPNDKSTITKNKFEIKKELNFLSKFDPSKNYFNEYWKMNYENEYILAKIKETVYEINLMQSC